MVCAYVNVMNETALGSPLAVVIYALVNNVGNGDIRSILER